MNGMIFAAGLGTRLKPLTDDRPKALVELNGKPLLEYVILKMKSAGIERIVINVHHYADQVEAFLRANHNFDTDIVVSDERACLLDTGGGLLKARELFRQDDSVLIHNVDILSDIDLRLLMDVHRQSGNYATLVVKPTMESRVLKFSKEGLLKGWENKITGEQKIVDDGFYGADEYSFCGIHIVSPGYLKNMVYRGVFSIIDEYIAQAKNNDLRMYFHPGELVDLGTPQAIQETEEKIKQYNRLICK